MFCTESVLCQEEGYTGKYSLSPREIPNHNKVTFILLKFRDILITSVICGQKIVAAQNCPGLD